MNISPILPIRRPEPFDDLNYLFELKYDGFRALADTVNGRISSKNRNRMKRYEPLLATLPEGFVFDGEIVALDEAGRPAFNDLLFSRRQPTYIAFDVLVVEGDDVRELPLKERKALLEKIVQRYRMEKTEPFFGEGRPLFNAVCRLDLEGIVAKRLEDTYSPKTKWFKILNPTYSQRVDRAELFERQYG
jgi:bifunctional non-homologous end joining protein LigD